MTDKIDTSTAAITALLDGVTPGPWTWECESGEWPSHMLVDADGAAVMWFDFDLGFRFSTDEAGKLLEKSRELVPALAAERDRLRAENERLRAALLPFVEAAEECDDYEHDEDTQAPVTAEQCRAARAALEGGE